MKHAFQVIILSAAVLMHNDSMAQLSLGIEGGPTVTNLTESRNAVQPIHYTYSFSMPVGLTASWKAANRWVISSGFTYMPIGAVSTDRHPLLKQESTQLLYTDCLTELRLRYISAPLRIQYVQPLGREVSLFAEAGPDIQLLVYAQQRDEGYGTIYGPDNKAQVADQYLDMDRKATADYRPLNITMEVAIGLKLHIGDEIGIIKIGRSRGINRIERHIENGSHTTEAYYLMVGYAISIQNQPTRTCR
jgi:hypothetical protein